MCTAVSWKSNHHYFGRNLDLHYSYPESITITPRNYAFHFRKMPSLMNHFAIIGVATVIEGYPLYYDATNEKGLSIAGLNFPNSCHYPNEADNQDNIAPFELIPWILGQCACVSDSVELLRRINLANIPFAPSLPLTPLHWIIADKEQAISVESTVEGLKIYPNELGILTNEPPFDFHMHNLKKYMQISAKPALDRFSGTYPLVSSSNGMGSFGLPGDYSSSSRFVRAAFVKLNSLSDTTENGEISQFFHILESVTMPRGCVEIAPDEYEITRYSSCCDTDSGIYYYTTYNNRQITAVNMHKTDLNCCQLFSYPMITSPVIFLQNET